MLHTESLTIYPINTQIVPVVIKDVLGDCPLLQILIHLAIYYHWWPYGYIQWYHWVVPSISSLQILKMSTPNISDFGLFFKRASLIYQNDYINDNNVLLYFFLDRKRSRMGNALAMERESTFYIRGSVCRSWRMSAIQAVSTRWFSAIYSRRSANLFVVKCAQDATNYRLAHGYVRRLPRARILALRLLTSQRGSILKYIGNVFTPFWTRSKQNIVITTHRRKTRETLRAHLIHVKLN